MDCTLLPRHIFLHILTNSSLRRSFVAPKVGFGQLRQRWLNLNMSTTGCWAIGVPGNEKADNLCDAQVSKGNQNGTVFGTLDAEITPETVDFFVSDADGDPDCPSEGYSSVEQALNTLRQGKFVIVVDDENGDTEGNVVIAASLASPRDVAFMVRHGSGI